MSNRELLKQALAALEGLAEQQAMPDDFWKPTADAIRSALAQPQAESVAERQKTIDAAWAAIGNDQMTAYIEKFGEPVPLVKERDALRAETYAQQKVIAAYQMCNPPWAQELRERVKVLREVVESAAAADVFKNSPGAMDRLAEYARAALEATQ